LYGSREAVSSSKKPAPPFKVTALSGEQYELSALRGKVVVLNFWFIGCGPCKAEIPALNRLVRDFRGQEVVFLAFTNSDSADDLRNFLKKIEFDYEIVPAEFGLSVFKEFKIGPYPTHIIIDRRGDIEATMIGGTEHRDEDIRPVITRLLKAGR